MMTADKSHMKHMKMIILLSIICYARIYFVNSTFWDDNCWLLSRYNSNSLDDFLNAGFRDLRRTQIGTFVYYLISLHKETDIYYPVFCSLTILVQTVTALFVYLFVRDVFRNANLAFFVALIALLYPVDTTTPIFTILPYRIGLLFSVISLYATVVAIREKIRWQLIAVSLLCAAVAQYVFIEGAIALEPARVLIIWRLLSEREKDPDRLRRTFCVVAGLFLLIIVPLVFYKLTYKPYGIYAGTYKSDPLFFLKWRMHRRAVVAFFFINWVFFSKYILSLPYALSAWSVILAVTCTLWGYFRLPGIMPKAGEGSATASLFNSFVRTCRENRFVFLLGLTFYVAPVLMYEFAGRVVFNWVDSRHGTLLVVGFALIWGGLFYSLYTALQFSRFRLKFAHALMAGFIGIGVFFHNVNHDLYLASQHEQQRFWQAFTKRFPTLPEKSAFLFDVEFPTYLYDQPFGTTYGIELYLNLLYARSDQPDGFKNFIAAPVTYWHKYKNLSTVFSNRHPGTGHLFDENEPLFVVKYKDGEVIVNTEILEKCPEVPYKGLLVKNVNGYSQSLVHYQFRHKLSGFYRL